MFYLLSLQRVRNRGGVISRVIANATATALIKRHPEYELSHIDLENSSWWKSCFQRMGFVRRAATTGKVPISKELREEVEMTYYHSIVTTIETKKIPPSLVINLDQTPSKFVPGCNKTLAPRKSKSVAIKGSTDKRTITATFSITMDGKFLPMQIIYAGKTSKSIPKIEFPKDFHVTANPKHYSNEEESIKMMEHIIIPYVKEERKSLNLSDEHPALLIMDVFKGQMTDAVKEILKKNNIILQKVPANLTYLFQPLDVQGGPNGYAKRYLKNKFTIWYADKVQREMDAGKPLELIDIDFKLSTLKSLHAKWLLELFNHMTSEEGRQVNVKGWEVSGILGAVEKGITGLDPFDDIDPLSDSPSIIMENQTNETTALDSEYRMMYVSEPSFDDDESEEESNWVDRDGNCFDLFEGEESESEEED